MITDNAKCYRDPADFHAAAAVLGTQQRFIRPHCPWTNGKVERFNRTLQTEWAASNTAREQAPAPWLQYYNTQRRHTALGGRPPITRLTNLMTEYTWAPHGVVGARSLWVTATTARRTRAPRGSPGAREDSSRRPCLSRLRTAAPAVGTRIREG